MQATWAIVLLVAAFAVTRGNAECCKEVPKCKKDKDESKCKAEKAECEKTCSGGSGTPPMMLGGALPVGGLAPGIGGMTKLVTCGGETGAMVGRPCMYPWNELQGAGCIDRMFGCRQYARAGYCYNRWYYAIMQRYCCNTCIAYAGLYTGYYGMMRYSPYRYLSMMNYGLGYGMGGYGMGMGRYGLGMGYGMGYGMGLYKKKK